MNQHGTVRGLAKVETMTAAPPGVLRGRIAALGMAAVLALAAAPTMRAQDAAAQDVAPLTADRPGQATPPALVGEGTVQLEAGIAAGSVDVATTVSTLRTPIVARIGVLPTLELRVGGEYFSERISERDTSAQAPERSGVQAVAVGGKVFIAREQGFMPDLALLVQMTLPFGDEALRPKYVAPQVTVLAHTTLSDALGLYTNAGGLWSGSDAVATGTYNALLSFSPGALSCFVELYGSLSPAASPKHAFDAGLAWGASADLQLDLSGGVALTSPTEYFVAAGITLRAVR